MNSNGGKSSDAPIVKVRSLTKRYLQREGWRRKATYALRDVSLDIRRNHITAIVGDSGAGKSTLARCLAALERPDAGDIWFDDANIANLNAAQLRDLRPKVQYIFQDASTAMNPRFSAEEVI